MLEVAAAREQFLYSEPWDQLQCGLASVELSCAATVLAALSPLCVTSLKVDVIASAALFENASS